MKFLKDFSLVSITSSAIDLDEEGSGFDFAIWSISNGAGIELNLFHGLCRENGVEFEQCCRFTVLFSANAVKPAKVNNVLGRDVAAIKPNAIIGKVVPYFLAALDVRDRFARLKPNMDFNVGCFRVSNGKIVRKINFRCRNVHALKNVSISSGIQIRENG